MVESQLKQALRNNMQSVVDLSLAQFQCLD